MYKDFLIWLFDGKKDSEIPEELLSYKSPITHTYVISLFSRILSLNYFLDEYFNNINIYYLDKRDIFGYIKECVQKFGISNRQIRYSYFGRKTNLYNILSKKLPHLKSFEISRLCNIIDKLDNKDKIYYSLGISKPKITKGNKKEETNNKNSSKFFISKNFVLEK